MITSAERSRYWTALLCILAAGLALRLLGIGWGLPGRNAPDEPPIHPDEHVSYDAAENLYRAPTPGAFIYGGALYTRTAYLVGSALARTGVSRDEHFPRTLFGLRLISVSAALASALLVACMARSLFGPGVALAATALFLTFPNTVLDSHYARPDLLMTFFATGALACACRVAVDGSRLFLVLGGLCAGLATATMLSGSIGFVPLAVASLEATATRRGRERVRQCATAGACIAAGGLLGHAAGSVESFIYWDAFRAGLDLAARTHQGGAYRFPADLLTRASGYAFGSVATVAGYAGLVLLLVKRRPGSVTLASSMLAGYVLLGRVGGDMMRHLLFVAAPTAIAAAVSLAAIGRSGQALGRPGAWLTPTLLLHAGAIALTLQLSLAYVLPMQFSEEPRYRAGAWLIEHGQGARIGVTLSYYGDRTYTPRFPPRSEFELVPLMMRHNFDASRYLDLPIDYVVTTDFARFRAKGSTAPAFFEELFSEMRYRLVATLAPPWQPLSVPDWLGSKRPGDLLYVRPTFYIFERRAREGVLARPEGK